MMCSARDDTISYLGTQSHDAARGLKVQAAANWYYYLHFDGSGFVVLSLAHLKAYRAMY